MSNDTILVDLLHALDYSTHDDALPEDMFPFIGFLIAKATQGIVATVDARLAEFGITSRHYGIMLLISRHSGLPQAAIGKQLQIDRTTMVKLVDELEQLELVERHRDPNDRRAYALSLSAKGSALLPEIGQEAVESEHASLASLDQAEVRQLFHILLKLLKAQRGV